MTYTKARDDQAFSMVSDCLKSLPVVVDESLVFGVLVIQAMRPEARTLCPDVEIHVRSH